MRTFINFINRKISSFLGTAQIKEIHQETVRIKEIVENILIDNYLSGNLFENERYLKTKKITHFHKSVFTQNGEDGIIEEIFKRIGISTKYFVEFGAHGVKNNSTLLLVSGWKGLLIGTSKQKTISNKFSQMILSGDLNYCNKWITRDNIEDIFLENKVPKEFDLLSIDIDGNDYWIWKAINKYSPRVVCIEYNATYPPHISWVMTYNATHVWDQSSYFGASLKALENLGTSKGYKLIGCDFAGCNAFFVRADQNLDLFEAPFIAENHHEPPRYFLRRSNGYKQGFGPFETDL